MKLCKAKLRTHLGGQVRATAAQEGAAKELRLLLGAGGAVAQQLLKGGSMENTHRGGAREANPEGFPGTEVDSAPGHGLWWGFWR